MLGSSADYICSCVNDQRSFDIISLAAVEIRNKQKDTPVSRLYVSKQPQRVIDRYHQVRSMWEIIRDYVDAGILLLKKTEPHVYLWKKWVSTR